MHLPGHYLDFPTSISTAFIAGAAMTATAVKLRRASAAASPATIAAASAGIFAAQMVNFPVAAGVSGHLLGGALLGVLLGPWAAMLAMSSVLAVQAFVLGDGGITALGANVLNMAVVGPLVGYGINRALTRSSSAMSRHIVVAGLAGVVAVLLGATVCGIELAASGIASPTQTIATVLTSHLTIALSEGLITAAVVGLVLSAKPTWAADAANQTATPRTEWGKIAVALLVSVVAAIVLPPLASTAPDGLESAAQALGLHATAEPIEAAAWLGALGVLAAVGISVIVAWVAETDNAPLQTERVPNH